MGRTMRQGGTVPQACTSKDPRLNEANRRVTRHALPWQRTVMGARLPDARALTAGFCEYGRRAAFRMVARRRPSATGGEACPAPTVRQSRPLHAPITDEPTRTKVNVMRRADHHMLLLGPPGVGKSRLARRLTTILPTMTLAEAIETTRSHRVAGLTGDRTAFVTTRPFRAPPHTPRMPGRSAAGGCRCRARSCGCAIGKHSRASARALIQPMWVTVAVLMGSLPALPGCRQPGLVGVAAEPAALDRRARCVLGR
jgi:Magnesium chelatase, subunit ChlI